MEAKRKQSFRVFPEKNDWLAQIMFVECGIGHQREFERGPPFYWGGRNTPRKLSRNEECSGAFWRIFRAEISLNQIYLEEMTLKVQTSH